MKLNKNNGFTLIELLVVMGVIGTLGALFLPSLGRGKHRARDIECLNNQKNMRTAIELDYQDVITDYSERVNEADYLEISQRVKTFCSSSLVKDPYLGDLGVYASKSATCPFAFGNGKERAGFGVFGDRKLVNGTVKFVPYVSEGTGVRCVTFSYDYAFNLLDTQQDFYLKDVLSPPSKFSPIVSDRLNENYAFQWDFHDTLPELVGKGQRIISFNNRVLHPHKGIGRHATFGDGQMWQRYTGAP